MSWAKLSIEGVGEARAPPLLGEWIWFCGLYLIISQRNTRGVKK